MELFSSGEFPSVVAVPGCSSCAFSLDARSKQKPFRAITKKELAYLLRRLCTIDATTMRVCIVNSQVVPPFARCDATLARFLLIGLE